MAATKSATNMITVKQAAERIKAACLKASPEAGLFCNLELVPIGGFEVKIKPPTYAKEDAERDNNDKQDKSKYAEEKRFNDGEIVDAVYINSLQAGANRLGAALLHRMRFIGDISIPEILIKCEYDKNDPYKSILQMPHRYSDFHIKDSTVIEETSPFIKGDKGKKFRDSSVGQKIYRSMRQEFLEEILRYSPTSVLLGAWHSFKSKTIDGKPVNKEISQKLHRCVQTETIGIKVGDGVATTSRHDPIVDRGQLPIGANGKLRNISDIGGGNVLPSARLRAPGGINVRKITEFFNLHFHALLHYHTGQYAPGKEEEFRLRNEEDAIAREMLAWLALTMHILQTDNLFYRSGCALQKRDMNKGNVYTFSMDGASFSPSLEECLENYDRLAKELENRGRYDRSIKIKLQLPASIEKLAVERLYGESKGEQEKAAKENGNTNND